MPAIHTPPKTIQTWGCPEKFPHLSGPELQCRFDMWAFARRRGDIRRYELFKRIANFLVPNWFEWHDWTERVIDAMCRRRWVGIGGCSNCISGDTRILDAVTGENTPIKELFEKKIAPTVMTLYGPRKASVPFVKGKADLFEVTLSNGNRFAATAEHVVLSANGFEFVKSLSPGQHIFAYAPILPSSTSEPCFSGQQLDVFRCQRTTANSQDGYRALFRSCDEQLRSARVASRSPFPPQADVPERIQDDFDPGVLDSKHTHSHASFSAFRRSNSGVCPRRNFLDIHAPRLPGQETASPFDHSCLQLWQSLLTTGYPSPFAKPVHGFFGTPRSEPSVLPLSRICQPDALLFSTPERCASLYKTPKSSGEYLIGTLRTDLEFSSTDLNLYSCASQFKVALTQVVSIRKIGFDTFYDLSVPGIEHYFAEGAIHHNSAKTRNVAGFGCIYWLCAPEQTSFIMTSTTMKMLRKRGWAEIHNFYRAFTDRWGEVGNMVDSRTMWQHQPGDDKHAIFGLAVQEGDTNKAAANIQGIHTKRCLVGLDEAEEIPPAIWVASINLYSYPIDSGGEFTLVAAANPRSRLSRFGRFIEPLAGWDTVSVETEEWETKPQADGKKALMIRLDFLKSPNVKADRPVSKHLPTKLRVKNRMDALKAIGAENDPNHWTFDRGFPAPEGLIPTVFTESLLVMHKAFDLHQFTGENFTIIGAFDQAFGGGDLPTLRFGALGEIAKGKMGIEWMAPIEIAIDAEKIATRPVRYQLMDSLEKHCRAVNYRGQTYRCRKADLGIDCTGEGGLADICDQNEAWDKGDRVIRVQFSGAASDEPCSHEDQRLASAVYRNKRAQMYFQTRNGCQSSQIKGVDRDTAAELCTIEYFEINEQGKRVPSTIQSKKEYKLKYGKSPDYSDSGIMLTEVGRLRGFHIVETGATVQRSEDFTKFSQQAQQVIEEVTYAPENEDLDQYEDVFNAL